MDMNPSFSDEEDSLVSQIRLQPYRNLTQAGLSALMISPDLIKNIQSHFHSKDFLQDQFKQKLAYEGLLLSRLPEEADESLQIGWLKKMITSGSDLFIISKEQFPLVQTEIQNLIARGYWDEGDLDRKVRRILQAKHWTYAVSDKKSSSASEAALPELANSLDAAYLNQAVQASSLTLLQNQNQLLPFSQLREKKIHLLTIGAGMEELLTQMRYYAPISNSNYKPHSGRNNRWKPLPVRFLKSYDPIVIAFHDQFPDVVEDSLFFNSLSKLEEEREVVILNFQQAEYLKYFPDSKHILQAWSVNSQTQNLVAQLLFGGIPARGKLPVDVSDQYVAGTGLASPVTRLSYTFPEAVGIQSVEMSQIDSVMQEALGQYAIPGAQVLVARKGKVIYHKAFGHHTYARKRRVWLTDLYDLASVTKVAATTAATMDMYDKGKVQLNQRLDRFFKNQTVWMDSVRVIDTLFEGLASSIATDSSLLLLGLKPESQDSAPSLFMKAAQRTALPTFFDTVALGGDSARIVRAMRMGKYKREAQIFRADFRRITLPLLWFACRITHQSIHRALHERKACF